MRADFIGAGWAYPLGVRSNGAISTAAGVDKIEQAMQIILTTYPGERPMRPEFACRLRDFVFGSVSDENTGAISAEVTRALERWEPRADIQKVVVTPKHDEFGMYHIEIFYVVKSTNEERNLVFPFYTIPEEGEE
jgi:phage baseplate assembly protein W